MSATKDPEEVQDMKRQLAEIRRKARGVKDSARNLRIVTPRHGMKMPSAAAIDDAHHDRDDTTRKIVATR